MESEYNKEEKYIRAQKKVDEIKRFYFHLVIYFVVNLLLTMSNYIEDFFDGEVTVHIIVDTYWVWLFWGIGILFHGLRVFGFSSLVGKDWEDKKIKEFMDQNKND